ncbi:MAG: hypothetical protein OIF48_14650 [Silicimonas sp.]|nr:hypothetical protein [Silicimonas sp.]
MWGGIWRWWHRHLTGARLARSVARNRAAADDLDRALREVLKR